MNNLYTGTSAYKLEQYETYSKSAGNQSQQRKAASEKNQVALYRAVVAVVLAVFIAASALIYINVMILRATSEIEELENNLAIVIDQNKQKEMEINKNLDLNVIEKRAIEKLGMQKPDNSQIVYIDVKKGMRSEAVTAKKEPSAVLASFKKLIGGIGKYFS